MTRKLEVTGLVLSKRFRSDFRRAPENIRIAASQTMEQLTQNPDAGSLRLHTLKGVAKPTVWKVDVLPNHAWQMTFELEGSSAVLRRLATHADIDRSPR